MSVQEQVAVTGVKGRLGTALLGALRHEGFGVTAWSRPDYDLDDPEAASRVVASRPNWVVHAAAWTDVDGCAQSPATAQRRNADAVAELAVACAANRVRLVLVSTNEVFDGQRNDGSPYLESDLTHPLNPYGASKLAGEEAARNAYSRAGRLQDLVIVRTAWLFGPPGNDFPAKIIAAADRLAPDQPLKVVSDEIGSPTYTVDLAQAIARLIRANVPGATYHLVNEGAASRLNVARRILDRCRPGRQTVPISRDEFKRPSSPPAWAVLANRAAAARGISLRPWQQAIDAYAPSLCAA